VRAVDSGFVNTSQREGRTKEGWVDLIHLDLSLLGICRLRTMMILVYSSYLTYVVACSSYLKVDGRRGQVCRSPRASRNSLRRKVAKVTIIGYRVFILAPEGPFRLRGYSL
jgi:hypothetical protein